MGQACIYLVDDDNDVRQAVQFALERAGYLVRAFSGPKEFQSYAPSITGGMLLLDMRMPEISGLDVQVWLKEHGYRIPIVFISGESQSIEIIEAFKLKAVDFLLKPFPLAQLLEAVEKALKLDACHQKRASHETHVRRLWSSLTPREREVCHFMTKGYANREIAEVHQSLPDTVKLHRRRVLEKMQVDSLPALHELLESVDLSVWLAETAP